MKGSPVRVRASALPHLQALRGVLQNPSRLPLDCSQTNAANRAARSLVPSVDRFYGSSAGGDPLPLTSSIVAGSLLARAIADVATDASTSIAATIKLVFCGTH